MIRLARQILSGVAFLHRINVVHLDLKVSGPRVQHVGQGLRPEWQTEGRCTFFSLFCFSFLSWNRNSFSSILTFFPQAFQMNHYVFSVASPEGNRAVERFFLSTQSSQMSESFIRFLSHCAWQEFLVCLLSIERPQFSVKSTKPLLPNNRLSLSVSGLMNEILRYKKSILCLTCLHPL